MAEIVRVDYIIQGTFEGYSAWTDVPVYTSGEGFAHRSSLGKAKADLEDIQDADHDYDDFRIVKRTITEEVVFSGRVE